VRRPPGRVSRRRLLAFPAGLALAGAVWVLVGRAAGSDEVVRALGEADPRWLPLCLVGEVLSYAGYVLAYRQTARVAGGPDLPLRVAAPVIMLGMGGTALASAPGGLAVDYWALHDAGASREDAVRRVLALNTAKWLTLGVAAAVAGLAVAVGLVSGPAVTAYAWLAAVTVSVALAAWVSEPRRVGGWSGPQASGNPAPSRLRRAWALARRGFADAIGGVVYVRRLVTAPRRNATAFVGFSLYWLGDIGCLYAALRAFGVDPEPVRLVLAYATGYAATGLPLPLGGSGGVEAAMTYSLHAAGIALASALLGVAAYRLFAFWLPLLPAAVTLAVARRLDDELARVRRGPRSR
jgi:putative heme transporter